MLFLVFLSSGLFLGWSLGANDAANIFGTAVGSKMVSFLKAAWIASIFIILGAVFQGRGAANTLTDLGSVDQLGGAFTVALSAAVVVFLMTRASLPVSTSQAIVGAIVGWSVFSGRPTDMSVLFKIVSTWITGPVLGIIFGALLYLLVRHLLRKLKVHVIKLDSMLRIGLIVAGAFGAYSLGANNIANVMGVFVPLAPNVTLDFGLFALDGVQLLFLLGALAISVGVFTYSKRVMLTVGKGIFTLTPEAAFVVVLAQAIVLFLFSSSSLSNLMISMGLPPFPLVPVSSTQVVVGSVMGIGLVKGGREIKVKTLGGIGLGWVITPLAAGLLSYVTLFFVQNVFGLKVASSPPQPLLDTSQQVLNPATVSHSYNLIIPAVLMVSALLIILLIFLFFRQQKLRLRAENQLLQQMNQHYASAKAMNELELNTIQMHNTLISNKLELKRQELNTVLLNISEHKSFLENIINEINQLIGSPDIGKRDTKLKDLILLLKQRMSFTKEIDELYHQIEAAHQNFRMNLLERYPNLTEHEQRLAILIRLGFASKEIATLMNISPKSAEIARYRLRKKLQLMERENLTLFLKSL
jgi:inorganic phosphate transporter, PiT family